MFIILVIITLPILVSLFTDLTNLSHTHDDKIDQRKLFLSNNYMNKVSQVSTDYNETEALPVNVSSVTKLAQGRISSNQSSILYNLLNISHQDQVIYYHIESNVTNFLNKLELFLYYSQVEEDNKEIHSNWYNEPTDTSERYGQFTLTSSNINKWFLLINYTDIIDGNFNTSFFDLTLFVPEIGYSFDNAFLVLENEPIIRYQPQFPFETLYWKISLNPNQEVNFTIKDAGNEEVLRNAEINLYEESIVGEIRRPDLIPDPLGVTNLGEYFFHWAAPSIDELHKTTTLWIKLKLDARGVLGNLSILFSFEKLGYSFDTAIPIAINQSTTIYMNFSDRWVSTQYFQFDIAHSGVRVEISTDKSAALDAATVRIYDNLHNEPLSIKTEVGNYKNWVETQSSLQDNVLNGSFYAPTSGTYYLTFTPKPLPFKGSFNLVISYIIPPDFIWKLEYILITIISLIGLPFGLFYFTYKLPPRRTELEIKAEQKVIFNALSNEPRLSPKKEVPFDKILLDKPSIILSNVIIDFVSLDEETTSISINFSNKYAIRYLVIIPIVLLIYWLIDVFFFVFFGTSILPIRVTQISALNFPHLILWFPITIFFSFFIVLRQNIIRKILLDISFTIRELTEKKSVSTMKSINVELINKNLAYVRVLWNQAMKAFKDNNYSLFIIKADTSVKKLLEIRFVQLYGKIEEKLEFNDILEQIRNQGFDIPSMKKIEYFRKIRNKVVHSSHLLDEKTAIETYAYYSKFLTRLGIRV
ncbi:MAG: hypothetical protein ACXAC7_00725 [Candidatus Hodarchaeales archaeon]|jgi:hypothetical protein